MKSGVAAATFAAGALLASGCTASTGEAPTEVEQVAAGAPASTPDAATGSPGSTGQPATPDSGAGPTAGSGESADESGGNADEPVDSGGSAGSSGQRSPDGGEDQGGAEDQDNDAGQDGDDQGDGSAAKQEPKLDYGSDGPKVRALQRKLRSWHYSPGTVDGVFGASTRYALWAFQKVNGLNPDGVVGPKTRAALADRRTPEPLVPDGAHDRVEIDLSRQLLFVYEGGELALISHISSGSEEPYCTADGNCGDAVTPTGDFATTWRVDGWRQSDLGRLYNPVYFVGGIAVHGSTSVPRHPASHGCVRIPMHTAETFPELVGEDEAVYVRD